MQNQFNIPVSSPSVGENEIEYVTKALKSSWISSLSPSVREFEEKFSRYSDSKFGVTTNSGTTALHLALAALNVNSESEVIIPSFTMIATANAIEYQRGKIQLVDANSETWNIDPGLIEEKINDRTKVIMPVDIYGFPIDADSISKIAKDHELTVVEDAAEAHGAMYKGRKAGSLGEIGCFSFYANKIITTGEGGMCVTSNKELAERMAWLRAHAFGREGKHFWHEELGFGYRMSALQAALGLAQMEKIDKFVNKRISNAKLYNEYLSEIDEKVTLPPDSPGIRNVYWMYSILLNSKKERDGLMDWLASKGVETRTFFYPIHRQPYYSKRFAGQSFPVSDMLSDRGMNLPSSSSLTEEQIMFICEKIKEFFRK
jgi:perosamine synthetase